MTHLTALIPPAMPQTAAARRLLPLPLRIDRHECNKRPLASMMARRFSNPLAVRSQRLVPGSWANRFTKSTPGGYKPAALSASLFPSESIFCSRVANCLEKCHAGFHYSVIGGYAKALLASGYAGSHPLNDEVRASKFEAATPDANAQGGDE